MAKTQHDYDYGYSCTLSKFILPLTRIKATVASTMYEMTRVNARGYFDAMDADARYELRKALNAQRIKDYKNGSYQLGGGVVDPLPEDAPFYVKDYYDYYKTERGYHKRSLNSNGGWNMTSALSFMNMPILAYSDEIRSVVLVIHGEKAHSCYFSKDAFKHLKGDNKKLLIIPDAVHTCTLILIQNRGAFLCLENNAVSALSEKCRFLLSE